MLKTIELCDEFLSNCMQSSNALAVTLEVKILG